MVGVVDEPEGLTAGTKPKYEHPYPKYTRSGRKTT